MCAHGCNKIKYCKILFNVVCRILNDGNCLDIWFFKIMLAVLEKIRHVGAHIKTV